jgi:hypothetical protein
MTQYTKNKFRVETIQRFGATAGLPLFEAAQRTLSNAAQNRLDAAPRAIPTGNETRRRAHWLRDTYLEYF